MKAKEAIILKLLQSQPNFVTRSLSPSLLSSQRHILHSQLLRFPLTFPLCHSFPAFSNFPREQTDKWKHHFQAISPSEFAIIENSKKQFLTQNSSPILVSVNSIIHFGYATFQILAGALGPAPSTKKCPDRSCNCLGLKYVCSLSL